MSKLGQSALTAGLVILGVSCPVPQAYSAKIGSYNSIRVAPPIVKRRLVNPDSLRPKAKNPDSGKDKGTKPTAEPQPPKRKKGKPPKRLASPPASPPPTVPGLPIGRPDVFPEEHTGNLLLAYIVGGFEPKTLLVALPGGASDPDAEAIAQQNGLTVLDSVPLDLLQIVLVRMRVGDNEQIPDVVDRLRANQPDLIVTPNYYYKTSGQAQAASSIQFAPQRMSVAEAHKVATGNAVKIAIIDTGIDNSHVELAGSISEQFDAVGAAPDAPTRHGTAIAGVIAAKDQITGIAPNVEILSAQAFAPPKKGDSASGTTYAIIKSMDWAYKSGARVFNLSFAGPKDQLLIRALDALADHNTIMIGAAGNAGPGKPPAYPAAHDGVIAVTATDHNDALYTMANRGSYVAVAAPGVDIITTTPGGGYEFMSGTSIATAHVTGVVALVLERHPELKADAMAQLLANASIDLGPKGVDSKFGAGLVDAVAALKSGDELAGILAGGLTAGQ